MRVVFLGDSLTEGSPGAAYLDTLARRIAGDPRLQGVELVNAGVGGDTAPNLVRRIDRDVVPLAPDWVVILVGVNDAATWLLRRSLPTRQRYHSLRYFTGYKGIRRAVTPVRYQTGLRVLVDGLRLRTAARIALCTPATSGESLRSREWRALDRYAEAVRWVAAERDCPLIDVHAAFARELATLPPRTLAQRLAAARRRWPDTGDVEAKARERGYALTFDGTHLTARGAALVASVMYDWLLTVSGSNTESPAGAS